MPKQYSNNPEGHGWSGSLTVDLQAESDLAQLGQGVLSSANRCLGHCAPRRVQSKEQAVSNMVVTLGIHRKQHRSKS